MSNASRRKLRRIARQTGELSLAAPQVVAHRITRMVTAGTNPSARDVREFRRMGAEKSAAFGESWMAMGTQVLRANQQLGLSLMRSWWNPWFGGARGLGRHAQQLQGAALGVIAKGIAPVHKRAVANAARLGRAKRK